jgi:hypothetical protein
MKHPLALAALVLIVAAPSLLSAQLSPAAYGAGGGGGQTSSPGESRYTMNHAEFGAYADYFRFSPASSTTNYVGVGGRASFSVQPNLALEGEMNSDFARNYTTTVSVPNGTSTTTTFVTSSIRPLTGLFGPKLQFGTSSPFRVFVTGKLGFLDFSSSTPTSVTGQQFSTAVNGVGGSGTHLAFYPGGGFEGFFGPIGLRAEVGDEIFLDNGTFNNMRVTVGPTIRF